MKKLLSVLTLAFISHAAIAGGNCPEASSTNDASFCPTFQTAAQCRCSASGVPKAFCQDMNKLYDRMIAMFGSLQRACEYQKDTTTQTCIDDWNCYRNGGVDSQGRMCSGTGTACQ